MIEKLVFVDKFLFSADIRCAKKANKLYLLLYFDPRQIFDEVCDRIHQHVPSLRAKYWLSSMKRTTNCFFIYLE